MQVRFDWFELPDEMTIADVCRRKAVNLVIIANLTKRNAKQDFI